MGSITEGFHSMANSILEGQKIKKSKADETAKTESVRLAVLAAAASTGDENTVNQYSKIVEAMKGDSALEGLKLIHSDLQTRIKAKAAEGVRQEKLAKEKSEITSIGDAIISGDQPPDLTRLYGKSAGVKKYLADQGFDLTKATNDWTATQTLAKALNGPQQLRLSQAISSVEESIPELLKVSREFERVGWVPANKAELKIALSGTDKNKKEAATRYITQIDLMKDELAQSFQGGGVPSQAAFKLADDILEPAYGVKQLEAGVKQLQSNLKIRRNAISNSTPNFMGGNNKDSETEIFKIGDKTYTVPMDKVSAFKKAKGIK
jgi:hypothetical protein